MMTTATARPTDQQLKSDIERELEWRPEIDAPAVGVAVEDGTVVLSGLVRDYAQRLAVKDAVLRVRGVAALVNDLRVAESPGEPEDWDLASEVRHALASAVDVPEGISAEVDHGRVTLSGEVEFDVQRRAAARTVRFLRGVTAVDNRLELRRKPSAEDAVVRIENALRRNAIVDAHRIGVRIEGDTLILDGIARSWAERYEAAVAAAASPHVTRVINNIVVHPL